jgi:hypothetical protein
MGEKNAVVVTSLHEKLFDLQAIQTSITKTRNGKLVAHG